MFCPRGTGAQNLNNNDLDNIKFQSSPAPDGTGANGTMYHITDDVQVSILARPRRDGRWVYNWRFPVQFYQFQSSPAPDGTGAGTKVMHKSNSGGFNPRPPQTGRALYCRLLRHSCLCFNPRPPQTGRVLSGLCGCGGQTMGFNPRPPQTGRALHYSIGKEAASECFNPRPPQTGRALQKTQMAPDIIIDSFNPRPPQTGRALASAVTCDKKRLFQSSPAPDGTGASPLKKRSVSNMLLHHFCEPGGTIA